jgi:hypothetical protein
MIKDEYITSLECNSCPRGYKTDGWVCRPCNDKIEIYSIFYLIFMFGMMPISTFWAIDENTKNVFFKFVLNSKNRLFFYFLSTIQILVSIFFTLLINFPDFRILTCRVQSFADWYPIFFYGSKNCSNEVGNF